MANLVDLKKIGVQISTDLKFDNLDGAVKKIEKQKAEFRTNIDNLKQNP